MQLIEPASADGVTFRFRHSLTRDAIVSTCCRPTWRDGRPGRLPPSKPLIRACLTAGASRRPSFRPPPAARRRRRRLLLTAARRAVRRGALTSAIGALQDAHKLIAGAVPGDARLDIEIDEALAEAFALSGDDEHLSLLADDLVARLEEAGADPRRLALIRLRAASARPEDNYGRGRGHLAAAADIALRVRDAELGAGTDCGGRPACSRYRRPGCRRAARAPLAGRRPGCRAGWVGG